MAGRARAVGLRPAWLGAGDIELFHNEVVTHANRLREAGVDTTLVVVPGAPHGFENWARRTALAEELVAEAQQWLGLQLRRAQRNTFDR